MHSISMLWNVLQPHIQNIMNRTARREEIKSTLRTTLMWLCFIWQTFKLEFAQQCRCSSKNIKMVKQQEFINIKIYEHNWKSFFEGRHGGVTSCVDKVAWKIFSTIRITYFMSFLCVRTFIELCVAYETMWYSAGWLY